MLQRLWKRFVAFWIGNDPCPEYSYLDRLDGLPARVPLLDGIPLLDRENL